MMDLVRDAVVSDLLSRTAQKPDAAQNKIVDTTVGNPNGIPIAPKKSKTPALTQKEQEEKAKAEKAAKERKMYQDLRN